MNYRFAGVLPVLAGLALALSVFACGSGDDSSTTQPTSPSPAPATTPTPTTTPMTTSEQIETAARNAPVSGSVTQGSYSQGSVTGSTVSWNDGARSVTINRDASTSVTLQADPEDATNKSSILDGVDSPTGVIDLIPDPDSNQRAIAQVLSGLNLNYPEDTSGEFSPTFRLAASPPVVFGIWAVQNSENRVTTLGSFADGGNEADTPSGSIPQDGTYTGELLAFYQDFDDDGDLEGVDYSVGQVTLTVSGGSVTGSISRIANSGDDSNTFRLVNRAGEPALTVVLNAATPEDGSHFFSGTTSVTSGGQPVSTQGGTIEGRWGGEFFGQTGQYIGGTIGLNVRVPGGRGCSCRFPPASKWIFLPVSVSFVV